MMKKVRKAIIPAAGLGTRFLPATKAMPKEMLPIVDKPTIQYIVEEAIASGIEDIIIVTGKGKRAIEDHFDYAPELENNLVSKEKFDILEKVRQSSNVEIHYIRQKEPKGLGHAVWCARKFIGDEPFADEPIKIFNNGDFERDLYRDFTYIDDIVEGIERLLPNPSVGENNVPHKVFNIGNNNPEKLMVFIETLEKCLSNALGREVLFEKIFEPIKPGDVPATYASTELLQQAVEFKPETSIEEGLQKFSNWYVSYYNVK